MIHIDNVRKIYPGFELKASLDVPTGRVTGLVGRNGAGKSTIIKSILGIIKPDGGSVEVLGREASELRPEDKMRMGVALSDSGFSGYLKLSDIACILDKTYSAFNKDRFLAECKRRGLPDGKLIQKYSTGMKAKLSVLVAMCHDAELLIMDEPTAGMDIVARNEILDIIRDYMTDSEDASMLITSHIAGDLESICDDIYLIDNGQIILHEDTDVILSDYAILKLDEATYERFDKEYLLASHKEKFGYRCLTNQRQFYVENYPDAVIEHCGIDDLILMMTEGGR